ncbi:MAG TPA: VTT domain-containing protein [Bryobacteraceae bacterium]|nr:VTT domain-containing protein [Bryobacteraceae bacterium]
MALLKLGGWGLLILAILDSSFLFAPFGTDLLLIALTARYHTLPRMLSLAVMASAGSVLGCVLVDLVVRPAAEKGLERHFTKRRLDVLKRKISRQGGWVLVTAALAPPPFPFTPVIMVAAAMQYPARRMAVVIGAARLVRYCALGAAGLWFGPQILGFAHNPVAEACLIALIVFSIAGSGVSVYRWIERSNAGRAGAPQPK